jgi:hypothetical protein
LDALESISSNACGFDGVSLKFLKLITEYVIDPLTHLVNYPLSTSCFSKHWKKNGLISIPKNREIRGWDDLRPISILPCISQVVKRVVHNQLAHNLCVHGLLVEFFKNHITTTALLKVSNDLRESFNRGMVSLLFLLDFSKAFDKINHGRLLKSSELLVYLMMLFLGSRLIFMIVLSVWVSVGNVLVGLMLTLR